MRAANARLRRRRGSTPRTTLISKQQPIRPGQLVRVDEEVLHDLSHELGNFFHKLYYWTEYIKSGADDLGPDSSAGQMLESTVRNLESFLHLALEYFQPARLRPVRMSGAEIGRALESLLHAENPEATVELSGAEEVADAALEVDPSVLSTGMRIVARHLGVRSGKPGEVTVRARLQRRRGAARDLLEIAIEASGGFPDETTRSSCRVVEWAVAGRMVEVHGGELTSNEERQGAAGCVLTLPLAS